MFLYLLINLTVGIEAGVNQPLLGFDNLNSGSVFGVYLNRNLGFTDIALSAQGTFYQGKNLAYSFNSYGLRCGFSKRSWRFSPIVELGMDYVLRKFNSFTEAGIALNYGFGFLINFKYESLTIYTKFYYDGITDLRKQAGFIGIKLGIGYEI